MIDFPVASPKGPALAVAVLATVLMAGGCASTQPERLSGYRERAVRELTMQCYQQHDGERFVYGGLAVHAACRQWAEDRAGVTLPVAEGLALH